MKTVLLIGLGRFGKQLAVKLTELGHEVMAVDRDEDKINEVIDIVTNAQIGDSTNIDFLKSLGINNFDVIFVAIANDFQSSLETTSLIKELGGKRVVARAERDVQAKFLLRNGADDVVYPEKQVANWAAMRYCSDHILDYVELDKKHAIFEVEIPKDWLGKSIAEIDIRKKYDIIIVAVKENNIARYVIGPDSILTENQTLLVLGEIKTLKKCFHI